MNADQVIVRGMQIVLVGLGTPTVSCSRPSEQSANPINTSTSGKATTGLAASQPSIQPKDMGKIVDLIATEDAVLPKGEFEPAPPRPASNIDQVLRANFGS